MGGLEAHALQDHESFLYSAGIVTQLGLTAYLFGKGLTDDWCRERIGLDVEQALAFANHLGLGCNCPRIAVLVQLLGNYGQWRNPSVRPEERRVGKECVGTFRSRGSPSPIKK